MTTMEDECAAYLLYLPPAIKSAFYHASWFIAGSSGWGRADQGTSASPGEKAPFKGHLAPESHGRVRVPSSAEQPN